MVQKTMKELPQAEGVLGSEGWHLLCDHDVSDWSMGSEFLWEEFLKAWQHWWLHTLCTNITRKRYNH